MPAGRPPKYSKSILTKTNEYIKLCEDEVEEYHSTRGKISDTYERIVKVKLPTLEGLAAYLGVHKDTIQEWKKVYPDFSVSLGNLLAKQANMLINNGLSGDYNSTIAKLMLSSNHGYKEKTDVTTNDKDLPMPILGNLRNVPSNNSNPEDTKS